MSNLETVYSSKTCSNIKIIHFLKYSMPLYLLAFVMGRVIILNGLIPFGLAFFASILSNKKSTALSGLFTIIGYITVYKQASITRYILSVIIFYVFFLIIRKKDAQNRFKIATIASLSNFICGWIFIIQQGILLYDIVLVICESIIIFLMVYVFSTGLSFIFQPKLRTVISNQEMISISILLCIAITGIFDYSVWGCSLKNIFSLLMVILLAYVGGSGIGAAIGLTVSLFMTLTSNIPSYAVGMLGFCGMMAGVIRRLGRVGTLSCFVVSYILFDFYINRSLGVYFTFREIALASLLFVFIPKNIIHKMNDYMDRTVSKARQQKGYEFKFKDITISRLKEFSETFKELSASFSYVKESSKILDKHKITELFKVLTQKVCESCPLYKSCWDRDFYITYQNMFEMLAILESEGDIDMDRVPRKIKKKCLRLEKVMNELNNVYNIYKLNYKWQKKVDESKNLISYQLNGISQVIEQLTSELNTDIKFDASVEEDIYIALDCSGINIEDVVVTESGKDRCEIDIVTKYMMTLEQIKKAQNIVSDVMGAEYITLPNRYINKDKGRCYLRLVQLQNYQITVGVATMNKHNQKISGDSHSFMPINGASYLLALSDGMGSGSRACYQSSHTISLIEQFLKAGFEKQTAVKIINSILMLRDNEEIFSTGDICIVNLIDGSAEFVKIGAAASYIKHNRRVDMVKSDTLPIGILTDIDVKLNKARIKNGDYIIMVTDGVIECAPDDRIKEEWLCEQIESINTQNPQEMAQTIIDIAKKSYNGFIKDDMTVLVAKVWKSI